MKKYIHFLFIFFLFSCAPKIENPSSIIIPQPQSLMLDEGHFHLSTKTGILFEASLQGQETQLVQWLDKLPAKYDPASNNEFENFLKFKLIQTNNDSETNYSDEYSLKISPSSIEIEANSFSGLFYAIQSLRQLYYVNSDISCQTIKDSPRFIYRGLLLDVSSHYVDIQFIKKQIEAMSYYKMNRLLLYFAGDGGWRVELEKYPWLTEKAGWRTEKDYTKWVDSGGDFSTADAKGAYGGVYTKDEISDLVELGRNHFVEIIPTMEIPMFTANLGGAYKEHIPFTNSSSDNFAQHSPLSTIMNDIVVEVMSVFSTDKIYIGNGETNGVRGTECISCLPRVAEGTLSDVEIPQNALLLNIEEYLKKRNANLITWESAIRANIDRDETSVIAWHEESEGLEASKRGYQVVLAPAPYFSLDYYQTDPVTQPASMSGFLPLEKTYYFNPNINLSQDSSKVEMGIQANMWTTYMETADEMEYMLYPRLLAVAEVGWTYPSRKSYFDFKRRVISAQSYMHAAGYNSFDLAKENLVRPESNKPLKSIAKGRPVRYFSIYDMRYAAAGNLALTDGRVGGWSYDDGFWQGFQNTDIDIEIDLSDETTISEITAVFMHDPIGNIHLPFQVEIQISDDGDSYRLLEGIANPHDAKSQRYALVPYTWKGDITTRFVRYIAKYNGPGNGWMFTDEIIIN